MNTLPHFQIVDGRGYFRPTGSMSLREAVVLVEHAITSARDQGLKQLLIDATHVSGFSPPTIFEKYNFVTQWATAAAGKIHVAMVARPEWIDPQKFGVTVAVNRGFDGNVFVSEGEAIEWLDRKSK